MRDNKIFIARKSAGLTRNKVFEITNIPVRTLSDWETEKRKPSDYLEQMVIDKINRFALKQRLINGVKRAIYFPELEKMDYLDGSEHLISNGYSKSNRYEALDGDHILVSEYWKVTISEDDIDYDRSKDEEYNTSIISWEYKIPCSGEGTMEMKWNGYWNEVKSVGE